VVVTDPRTGASHVERVTRAVVAHAVVVVDDLLGGALTADGAPVWPPPGDDPLAGARAAGAALRLSPDTPPLTPVAAGAYRRAREVVRAAGHDFHEAAYDWRLAPRDAAQGVAAAVESARGAATATVVAHGIGGLALRSWLHESGSHDVVDDAVFVGTPQHGLPAAFRWLRFGGVFGPAGTSRLGDAIDAVAAAAGRDVVASWPVLYHALPGPAWFGAGPILHDRAGGAGWITDPVRTYTTAPGRLADTDLVTDALEAPPALPAGGFGLHVVVGTGVPTECLYSYGPMSSIVNALADPLAAPITDAFAGAPEMRSLSHGDESLVITMLDGDGVVPTGSAAGGLAGALHDDECRVTGVAHEDLLDDTAVLAYLVYVVEHLG